MCAFTKINSRCWRGNRHFSNNRYFYSQIFTSSFSHSWKKLLPFSLVLSKLDIHCSRKWIQGDTMDDTATTIIALMVFMLVSVIYLLVVIRKYSNGELWLINTLFGNEIYLLVIVEFVIIMFPTYLFGETKWFLVSCHRRSVHLVGDSIKLNQIFVE